MEGYLTHRNITYFYCNNEPSLLLFCVYNLTKYIQVKPPADVTDFGVNLARSRRLAQFKIWTQLRRGEIDNALLPEFLIINYRMWRSMNFGQILTAMVTPFDHNEEIDFPATRNLINYLIAQWNRRFSCIWYNRRVSDVNRRRKSTVV